MKFGLESITLWLKNGQIRSIKFLPGKVNVITGKSNTGKTAILDIFDYCLTASNHEISESIINESVSWYGLSLYIGEKRLVICRASPIGSAVSSEYFLSTIGVVPDKPFTNATEAAIKTILQTEFGIDDKIITPFGGQKIRNGSQLSFRYFLLFCTLSQDIITNSSVFFDKQSQDRYREALPRVFDLAMGIDDASNILAQEKRYALESELQRLDKRIRSNQVRQFQAIPELQKLATKAVTYGLASEEAVENTAKALSFTIQEALESNTSPWKGEYEETNSLIREIDIKIRNAKRFINEYKRYKSSLLEAQDSLRPIEVLADSEPLLIRTSEFDQLIEVLKSDLALLKETIKNNNPVDIQVQEILRKYNLQRTVLINRLMALPVAQEAFKTEREKWMFIGEAKSKLEVYGGVSVELPNNLEDEKKRIELEISKISVKDVSERRDLSVRNIEKNAQHLLDQVSAALENYANYEAIFSYKEKKLQLRKPQSMSIENVGSSSNHMFLHLVHMLSLQELAISNESKFVPSFLIIDQPSRPYYGEDSEQEKALTSSDTSKITSAMRMLNSFVASMKKDYSSEFQMIVFEHIPPVIWEGLDNFHLVEVFKDGNALIPESSINNQNLIDDL